MIKFFKRSHRLGEVYACNTGKHAGKMLVYMDNNKHEYGFLAIPTMENLWVPINEFEFAIDSKILEYVERVPKKTREVTKAKFLENKEGI